MLKRTLASANHSEEETKEEETLKDEEDTSTATGEAEENETESEEDTSTNEADDTEGEEGEESVEALKARLQKAEEDRDNYKQGMLSAKGKKRGEEGLTKTVKTNVSEEAVMKVLAKREEQKALQNTISPKHSDYIPELVDDNQYQEIIGYLPRNVDKTSYESIVRGLKLAVKMWKEERGIVDKQSKKTTDLHTTKSSVAGDSGKTELKKSERKILQKRSGPESWFN